MKRFFNFVAYLTIMAEVFQFEHSFGRILGMAYTAMFRYLSKLMKERNMPITPDQFRVLSHLWQKDGRPQNELAICTNRNRANITRIIDILEREGIVIRKDDPHDKRISRIHLTKMGQSLKSEMVICAEQSIKDSLRGLSKSDIEISLKVLHKIIENTRL